MDDNLLREAIRAILLEARHLTLAGQNRNDLDLAVRWVKINGKLKSSGKIEQLDDNTYAVRIRPKGSLDDASSLIKDRFGMFVRIVR